MTQTRGQDFDWSDCDLLDDSNRLFLRGERDFIGGEFERKWLLFFFPTFCAGATCALLSKTPIWFAYSCSLAVWLLLLWHGLEENRSTALLVPSATLLKGEVTKATLPDTLDYGGTKLFIRFATPDGQIIETPTDAQAAPEHWHIGDKVAVLFTDDKNFWVL